MEDKTVDWKLDAIDLVVVAPAPEQREGQVLLLTALPRSHARQSVDKKKTLDIRL